VKLTLHLRLNFTAGSKMQANLCDKMAAGLAPFLAQLTPQQQAQLLNMQLNTRNQRAGPTVGPPAVPVAPAQPKQVCGDSPRH
jgi:hypothetical protein